MKADKKLFLNKTFYIDIRHKLGALPKCQDLIKSFGGQIEQFLDSSVSYVLTDTPQDMWPPNGKDHLLERAYAMDVKLMSASNLFYWCQDYLQQASSSDDDDENRPKVRTLMYPYIKIEDFNCQYAPSVKELSNWPEINLSAPLQIGRSIFSNTSLLSTPTQTTTQVIQQNQQHQDHGPIKRRHYTYCEICGIKIFDKVEDHIQSQTHRLNTEKTDWKDLDSVIKSLPSFNTLNMRVNDLKPPNGVDDEFVCLHKVIYA